jgi:hypothetical protein
VTEFSAVWAYNPSMPNPERSVALLRGQLPPGRAQELQHEMLAVGFRFEATGLIRS